MNKLVSAGVVALALLTLAGCGSNSKSSKTASSATSSAKRVKKVKSINFLGGQLKLPSGTARITDVKNLTVKDSAIQGGKIKAIVVIGEFTNNSKKSITADDFFDQHLIVSQVSDSAETPLDATQTGLESETRYDSQIDIGMNAKILPGKTTAFARAWQLTDGDFTSKISVRSRATGKTRAGHWIVKPASNTETAGQTTTNNSTSNKVASTSNSSASSSASSSSSATSQTSASSSSTSSQPTTLAAFVAKYGESPVAYKMDHEGMTRKAALESTPASMMSSGEIQLAYSMGINK